MIALPLHHWTDHWTRLGRWAALASLLALASPSPAGAATLQDMVGRWYTELKEEGTFEGQKYTVRRQIEVNRPDSTKTVTFRFYDNCRLVGELINHFDWGVHGNVYWSRCTAIIIGARRSSCFSMDEYDILATGASKLEYKARSTGTVYNHARVADDFHLPDSACVGVRGPNVAPVSARR